MNEHYINYVLRTTVLNSCISISKEEILVFMHHIRFQSSELYLSDYGALV